MKNSGTKNKVSYLVGAIFTEISPNDDVSLLKIYVENFRSFYHTTPYGQIDESLISSHILNWVLQVDEYRRQNKRDYNIDQLITHIGIISVSHLQSLSTALIHDPSIINKIYLPGMPQNELSILARAMGHVGWYQCPNGHPYTVGEVIL